LFRLPFDCCCRAASSRYSPLPWEGHFDEAKDVTIPGTQNVFHVYMAGSQGPVVFCLHGGGYSGLSFALVAGKMKHKVRVVALDMRGHGLSRTDNDDDLSAETFCTDVLNVINAMYGKDPPSIVLVGHRCVFRFVAAIFYDLLLYPGFTGPFSCLEVSPSKSLKKYLTLTHFKTGTQRHIWKEDIDRFFLVLEWFTRMQKRIISNF
jgi:hypothetical protein